MRSRSRSGRCVAGDSLFCRIGSGKLLSTASLNLLGPIVHEPATTLEQVRPRAGPFDLVLEDTGVTAGPLRGIALAAAGAAAVRGAGPEGGAEAAQSAGGKGASVGEQAGEGDQQADIGGAVDTQPEDAHCGSGDAQAERFRCTSGRRRLLLFTQ